MCAEHPIACILNSRSKESRSHINHFLTCQNSRKHLTDPMKCIDNLTLTPRVKRAHCSTDLLRDVGRYQPILGPLADFLSGIDEENVASKASETASPGVAGRIVEMARGEFVKVPHPSHNLRVMFNGAVPNEPSAAAAAVVGMALGDLGSFQRHGTCELMAEFVKAKLTQASLAQAASFTLLAVRAVPRILLESVALPVFVEGYLAARPRTGDEAWADVDITAAKDEAMCSQARGSDDLVLIKILGEKSGKSRWMQAAERRVISGDTLGQIPRALVHSMGQTVENVTEVRGLESSQQNASSSISYPRESLRRVGMESKLPDNILDVETAISRTDPDIGAAGDDDLSEIHPETLSICESVRAKFGLNVEMENPELVAAFANLQQVTNRSIQRLAADLYAKEVHFVLELVQNCDDCTFPDGVEPALEICLSAACLEFHCNEIGFQTQNVLALCSIGESTKSSQVCASVWHFILLPSSYLMV